MKINTAQRIFSFAGVAALILSLIGTVAAFPVSAKAGAVRLLVNDGLNPIAGPLRVNPANPRYFTDDSGGVIYLTGSHTWANFQDISTTNPPSAFDYTAFLDYLQANNHNFTKLWVWEQSKGLVDTTDPYYFSPLMYERTGPGNALDGLPKFDLTLFNQAYFDRLRARVIEAGNRDIYVSIMLFDGWSVSFPKGHASSTNPWLGHPFNVSNNINGINGDANGDSSGDEIQTLLNPAVIALQEAYVRKVIDTVNDLDNVLYEINNEGNSDTQNWQYHLIDTIKAYEATKPKQHLVGMTVEYPGGDNAELFASPADWISPNDVGGFKDNPPAADGSKVIVVDTDHLWGIGGDRSWLWKSFTRGLNPIFMDCYNPEYCLDLDPNDPAWVSLRSNMGHALTYANRINLAAMTPRADLCSTGYCLANPVSNEAEYLVYLPAGGNVVVNLAGSPGTLAVEWFNPQLGTVQSGGYVAGGDQRTLTTPFVGDAVLYLFDDGSPTMTPSATPSSNGDTLYLSAAGSGTAGGVTFADEDILSYNKGSGLWSLYFDGSDVGLALTDVNAFARMSDGSILLSVDTALTIGSLGTVDDSDIVRFVPATLGDNTSGTFEWYFDGSDVGLTLSSEDIDAFDFTPEGQLVISTTDAVSVTGVASGGDEDLLAFSAAGLGSTTSGTWSLYFDGSDVGLAESADEDLNGLWIHAATGNLYMSTLGIFSVTGLTGDGADIFVCDPGTLGSNTTCSYDASLYWDGSQHGFAGQDVDGFDLEIAVATPTPVPTFTSTPTATPPPVSYVYPIKRGANDRLLYDQTGQPFFWSGDSASSLIVQPDSADVISYLDDRQAKGVNVIAVNLIDYTFGDQAPANDAGDLPFTGNGFTTPNEAYFSHVDWVISQAAARGMTVVLVPFDIAYECDGAGCGSVLNASPADMAWWGNYLGNRYKVFPNLVWVVGAMTDTTEYVPRVNAFVNALTAVDPGHLVIGGGLEDDLGSTYWLGAPWMKVNSMFTYDPALYRLGKSAYDLVPGMPFFLAEGVYENDVVHGSNGQLIRSEAYYSVLSGGIGYIFGNCPLWFFGAQAGAGYCDGAGNWQANLNSPGALHMQYAQRLFSQRRWYDLVPDWDHIVLTSGYGTWGSNDYVTAAQAADQSLMIAYLPSARTVSVDLTRFFSAVNASWYDPANGTYQIVSGSPFENTETRLFTSPGNNAGGDEDWVLVLQTLTTPPTVTPMPTFTPTATPTSTQILPGISDTSVADFTGGVSGSSCVVDGGIGDGALRLDGSSTSCVFESRILDAGESVNWDELNVTGTIPVGTSVSFETRTGNIPVQDSTWLDWEAVSGSITSLDGRYIQYRATLTSPSAGQTPVVEQVELTYTTKDHAVLNAPNGTLNSWDNKFNWTGVTGATHYVVEVYDAGNALILRKWYTTSTAGCDMDLECEVSPITLGNGNYTWRVAYMDAGRYGPWTGFTSFTLSAACYELTVNIDPPGTGTVATTAPVCGVNGYPAGAVVTLTASPANRFNNWSGDAGGTTSTVTVTMNGNKSVTGNFYGPAVVVSPSGAQTTWNNQFSWTGVSVAVSYELEVYNAGNVRILNQWFGASTNCTGLSCTASPSGTANLADGSYTWRVRDYNSNGYGAWTPQTSFSLSQPCYQLATNINPAGSGAITTSAQNCTGGYKPGTVVTLTASPVNRFNNWSGDASGTTSTVTVTMNGNKSVTGNFYGPAVVVSPSGAQTTWNNQFSWTGVSVAVSYELEVYNAGNVRILNQWFGASTNCTGLSCTASPSATKVLTDGSYTWRIRDYNSNGYGAWTPLVNFSVPCFVLTKDVNPAGSGTVSAPAQNCTGGYKPGTVVTLTASPVNRFNNWSGDASGTTSTVTVTMNGNKSVTGNFYGPAVVVSPSGAQTTWNNQFSWTGVSVAVSYELEVYNAGNVRILNQWFGASTNCTGLSCTASPSATKVLTDGSYTWRIRDYNSNGYGAWTPLVNFSVPCFVLTKNVSPAGSGVVNTPAQNCTGGYKPGTVVTLTASPVNRFNNWSGDASGTTSTVTVTMNGNKSVTGNFYGPAVVVSPSGAQTTWNNQFSWTGVSVAVSYELEVYNAGNVRILNQWFGASTNCTGLSCTASPSGTANLADGSYTWRVRDYNSNGYGAWTPLVSFNITRLEPGIFMAK